MSDTCIISAIVMYFLALAFLVTGSQLKLRRIFIILGLILHSLGFLIRGLNVHHFPIHDLYGSLLCLTLLIILRWMITSPSIMPSLRSFMLFFVIIILLTVQLLPPSFRAVPSISPAGQLSVRYLNIAAYLLGYMALFFASFYAFSILFSARSENSSEIVELGRHLDHEARLAFFFLNLGLITSAVWAFESRGSYWSGDIKETWALINILLLGCYFHLVKPRNYKKALVIVITLFAAIFTFIGIDSLLS
jgi:ABC-type transport system involved in cytochrome c biogenesis permease subunit